MSFFFEVAKNATWEKISSAVGLRFRPFECPAGERADWWKPTRGDGIDPSQSESQVAGARVFRAAQKTRERQQRTGELHPGKGGGDLGVEGGGLGGFFCPDMASCESGHVGPGNWPETFSQPELSAVGMSAYR
uniref:Uncharacterized protein n=1 Tax=Coccidioides posadasii RMSCC 3488 TaxID=454284 RepID=A0A0J6FDP9_COCPO|nr:hypothetical protein CPAG_07533 [Coccidioides posadasii RMSCC 3488]